MELKEAIEIIKGFKGVTESLEKQTNNPLAMQYCKGSITAIEECLKVLEEVE